MPFQIAIVGLGPAGIFALASLPLEQLHRTIVFEPNCIGGDLFALYGEIKANIPKLDIVTAFRTIPRWKEKPLTFLQSYSDTDCPLLSDVCNQIREWILPDIELAHFHTQRISKFTECAQGWKMETDHGETFETEKLILCIGAKPKTMNLPKQHVPLQHALSISQLRQHVRTTEKVVVFGTAHSGTLILKNLHDIGCKDVYAIYRGKTPFMYARDGVLGGIKQESANIADAIPTWTDTPTFLSYDDFSKLFRIVQDADTVIYSFGFEPCRIQYKDETGTNQVFVHTPSNAQFEHTRNVWGFGIGFPSLANGRADIGFKGFIGAIQSALPSILPPSL